MNLNKLKLIDKWFGFFIAVLLIPFALFYKKIFSSKNNVYEIRKVTVLKMLGGGSLLIFKTNIDLIKKDFPNAQISIVTTSSVAPFVELFDFDYIFLVDKKNLFSIFITTFKMMVKNMNADVFINLEPHSKLSSVLTFLTFPKISYALFFEFDWWQKYLISKPLYYNMQSPVYEAYDGITAHFCESNVDFSYSSSIFINKVSKLPSYNTGNKRYILLSPYCSELYKERQFDDNDWLKILHRRLDNEIQLVLVGSSADANASYKLESALKSSFTTVEILNLVGKSSFHEYISLVKNAEYVITVDTATVHLSRLLGKRTISYWGPSSPYTRLRPASFINEEVYYKRIFCSPCVHFIDTPPCLGDNVCMKIHANNLKMGKKLMLIR